MACPCFPRFPLKGQHLAHGAVAADYVWEERTWNWTCVPCNRVATDEHLRTEDHQRKVMWYGRGPIDKRQPKSANVQPIPTSPPFYCKQHGEVDNMYRYDNMNWVWYCLACGATATEGHCASDRHLKNVVFKFNQFRLNHAIELPPISFETWRRQATALGLDIRILMDSFGARPEIQQRPHILEFSSQASLPTLGQVQGFWGFSVYVFIRQVLQQLISSGTKLGDLWNFFGVEDQWQNVLVWSNANKEESKGAVVSGEEGIWWPAVAVLSPCGTFWWTYCQAFALQGAKKTWIAHKDRVMPCRAAPPPPPPLYTTHSTVQVESVAESVASGMSEVESVPSGASEAESVASTSSDDVASDYNIVDSSTQSAANSRRNRWNRRRCE